MPRAPTPPAAPAAAPSHAPRALWKGAISFGLVHIPVALHPATSEHAIDFDWLDERTLDPVGYKRINKRTGREIPRERIVKGIAHAGGRYVVLSDEEIAAAFPAATQTIGIEAFVPADAIPLIYLERPYHVVPVGKAARAYALLREALRATGRVGVARVVIHNRQHLAALVPSGPGLVLDLLRWSADIRSWEGLPLPAEGAGAADLNERELAMAARLVEDMSTDWHPEAYRDSFKDEIMRLVELKAAAGETSAATVVEAAPEPGPGDGEISDLTELLRLSLRKGAGGKGRAPAKSAVKKATPRKAVRAAPAKAPARRTA